jgi:excisionase family DNA binding protein
MKTTEGSGRRLRPDEAAEYLGLTNREFRSLREAGKIPAIKLGHRTYRYDTRDLDTLIQACRESAEIGAADV